MKSVRERIEMALDAMVGAITPTPSILTGRGRGEIAATVEFVFKQIEREKWRPIDEARGGSNRPVIVGRRGEPLMAMAVFHGQKWRHADSLEPVCFNPNVWQELPDAAPQGES